MEILTDEKIKTLKEKAKEIRKSIIQMLYEAGSGHTAGPLGMVEVFALLYFHILRHDPKNPNWKDRDRLVLSNGHICPVLYASMAYAGYFPIEELKTLRKFGSRLQGHPHREFLSYLETSSGPLGEGLSQAVGMAIVEKIDNKDGNKIIYCLISDGELDEGQTWEAIMLASKYKLGNLITIIDRNNIQISGNTENIMPLDSIKDKFLAFGWDVHEADGSNLRQINNMIEISKDKKHKPSVIIVNTTPGFGVKMFENNYKWHGTVPNKNEMELAIKELEENI